MTKSELIDAMAARGELTKARAELVVNCVFDAMTDSFFPPLALNGPCMSIRKFARRVIDFSVLQANGSIIAPRLSSIESGNACTWSPRTSTSSASAPSVGGVVLALPSMIAFGHRLPRPALQYVQNPQARAGFAVTR